MQKVSVHWMEREQVGSGGGKCKRWSGIQYVALSGKTGDLKRSSLFPEEKKVDPMVECASGDLWWSHSRKKPFPQQSSPL